MHRIQSKIQIIINAKESNYDTKWCRMKCHSYVGSVIAPIFTITTYVVILGALNVVFSNVLSANSIIRGSKNLNYILLMRKCGSSVKRGSKSLINFLIWESVYIWNKNSRSPKDSPVLLTKIIRNIFSLKRMKKLSKFRRSLQNRR